jgi:hypothetical protein
MATRTRRPASRRRPRPYDGDVRPGNGRGGGSGSNGGGPRGGRSGGRPPRRREADGRRRLPAGYAYVIILIALVFAALLNAQGMHKTAQIQEDGLGRDIAVPLTGALADVSHFFFLDRARSTLKAAIGRGDDDKVDTKIEFASAPASSGAAGRPAVAKPPPKPTFTPAHKMKVWVAGDSLSIIPGLRLFAAAPYNKVLEQVGEVDGEIATGLTRPDVFNWFEHIPQQIQQLKPNMSVFTFGANDDKAFMTGTEESFSEFANPEWEREYRRRVGGVMDEAIAGGRYLVWVGLPIVRDGGLNSRFKVLNRIYESEARKRPYKVAYVDAYSLFQDKNGKYADYLPGANGKPAKMRQDDGVHYENDGGDLLAKDIIAAMRTLVNLQTSVPTRTPSPGLGGTPSGATPAPAAPQPTR